MTDPCAKELFAWVDAQDEYDSALNNPNVGPNQLRLLKRTADLAWDDLQKCRARHASPSNSPPLTVKAGSGKSGKKVVPVNVPYELDVLALGATSIRVRTSDGRVIEHDLTVAPGAATFLAPGNIIPVGFMDPNRIMRGAILIYEVGEDDPAYQKALSEIQRLRTKRRRSGLTASELSRLQSLEAAVRGNYVLQVGLSNITNYYGNLVQVDAQGNEYISIFGPSRTLKAATPIMPGSFVVWGDPGEIYRRTLEEERQLLDLIARLSAGGT